MVRGVKIAGIGVGFQFLMILESIKLKFSDPVDLVFNHKHYEKKNMFKM